MRRRSLDADVKRTALVERAAAWLDQNQKAKARHDLDRVTAEDASTPGLADVRARLDAADA